MDDTNDIVLAPKPTKAQREYNEMERLTEYEEKLFRRLNRVMTALNKVRDAKKRLRKRNIPKHQPLKSVKGITGKDWHEIRNIVELNDPIDF